jgi:hypothetical protein
VSAVAPGRVIRRALAFVLTASALKLLNVGNVQLAVLLGACIVVGPLFWHFVRSTGGLRRGWPPAVEPAEGDVLAAASAPETGPGADVIPIGRAAGRSADPVSEPARLAGPRR